MHSPADALILLRFFKEKDILRKLPEGSKESTVKFVEIVFSAYESAFLISGSLKAKKEAQSILGEVAGSLLEVCGLHSNSLYTLYLHIHAVT